jgi:hypothetical protein
VTADHRVPERETCPRMSRLSRCTRTPRD